MELRFFHFNRAHRVVRARNSVALPSMRRWGREPQISPTSRLKEELQRWERVSPLRRRKNSSILLGHLKITPTHSLFHFLPPLTSAPRQICTKFAQITETRSTHFQKKGDARAA